MESGHGDLWRNCSPVSDMRFGRRINLARCLLGRSRFLRDIPHPLRWRRARENLTLGRKLARQRSRSVTTGLVNPRAVIRLRMPWVCNKVARIIAPSGSPLIGKNDWHRATFFRHGPGFHPESNHLSILQRVSQGAHVSWPVPQMITSVEDASTLRRC